MNKLLCTVWGCLAALNTFALETDDAEIQALIANSNYDSELCTTAQRIILNAAPGDYVRETLRAEETFVTEQMNVTAASNTITVAALSTKVRIGRKDLTGYMACKLVNQDRANTILRLNLAEPRGSCRDVNELTYKLALASLSEKRRQRFSSEGTPLIFVEDYPAVAGGEWLPSVPNDFIKPVGDAPDAIEIQAPSVQVPWPGEDGDWYQGTHHCKVITLTAMQHWMKYGAFDGSTELFPRPRPRCVEPDSRTSEVGSCLLYLGPAGGQFCQDYSGSGWTQDSAREDCAIRHATKTAWDQESSSYDGGGGIFSDASCIDRDVVTEAAGEPAAVAGSAYLGTCVFRCNTPSEALWHQIGPMATDPKGKMLEKTCDLFLKIGW